MVKFLNYTIEFFFYVLFFSVPLVLTSANFELFEYNKMMLTYALTVLIIGAWLIKSILEKRLILKRTPFDLPLLLFLLSQIISTIISIDPHVSLFGYYSRFHGGLASTICYIALFYAFVSNFPKARIKMLLCVILASAYLVSIYGILEHFGIDANIWVQDVKNRVFSTLGQPNWLAAYLVIIIPIAIGLIQSIIPCIGQTTTPTKFPKTSVQANQNNSPLPTILSLLGYLSIAIFYLTLLYTKSRSGFAGIWIGIAILIMITALMSFRQAKRKPESIEIIHSPGFRVKPGMTNKTLCVILSLFLLITFLAGSPFEQINKYFSLNSTQQLFSKTKTTQIVVQPQGPALEVGGTESGEIRKIVWKGALDIWKHYPVFGSGVETFAYSYYQYRPVEHNMVSEWDFLYNKAHNEYLNFLATTGAFGLGAYLLFILSFIIWNLKNIVIARSKTTKQSSIDHSPFTINHLPLTLCLFAGWLSILITNFFGFSVVIVGIFFFLIPAISFLLESQDELPLANNKTSNMEKPIETESSNIAQKLLILVALLLVAYSLFSLAKGWMADSAYSKGRNLSLAGYYKESFYKLQEAINLNYDEPVYHDEMSNTASNLAIAAKDQDATLSANLADIAVSESNLSIKISPKNVNFYKTRTKVFYNLSSIDKFSSEQQILFEKEALNAIKKASELAPTDPKVFYNLGILYGRTGDNQNAINAFITTTKLKPDFRDAYFALGLYYHDQALNEKGTVTNRGLLKQAIGQMQFILDKVSTADADAKEKLTEWQKL